MAQLNHGELFQKPRRQVEQRETKLGQTRRLSFCEVTLLRGDIAEVIVDEGVDIDLAMVGEYHDFLLSELRAPFSLLINKKNQYSYTANAQMKIANLPEINVMAVVSYSDTTEVATKALAMIPRESPWNLKIYHDREQALQWLIEQQDKPGA